MQDKILLTQSKEFTLKIENLSFALIVDINRGETEGDAMQLILHSHVASELFACNRGRAEIILSNETIILQKGDIAIIPPSVAHCLHKPDEASEVAALSFMCRPGNKRETSDLYKELSPFVSGERVTLYRLQPAVCERVWALVSEAEEAEGALYAVRMLEILLSLAKTKSELDGARREANIPCTEGYDIKRMAKLDQLIYRFYMYDLSAEYVANQLYISTRQLDRIVRRRYGKTLHKVVMEKRIKSAARLLIDSDMTIDRIATSVGFASAVGFYREFARCFDTTPAEYRKMKRENR